MRQALTMAKRFSQPVCKAAAMGICNPNIQMLAIIGIILILLWAAGLVFHIAGSLIHFILVLAVISFVIHLLTGRRVG
jgi:hypothetical protein